MALDMAIVRELGDDDQSHLFGIGFNPMNAYTSRRYFRPCSSVPRCIRDDVEQFLPALSRSACGDEEFVAVWKFDLAVVVVALC